MFQQAAIAIVATNAIEAFAALFFEGGCILRHAWRVPSVGGESGGSVAALSTGLAHSILLHWHHGNTL